MHPNILYRNTTLAILATAAGIASHTAIAYEKGDWIVRAGYATVDPRDNSSHLKLGGNGLAGTGVGVDGASALGVTISYMLSSNIGVELLAATPFQHDITSQGLTALGVPDGTRLGSTRQLPPTISAQYYFAPTNSAWQPYVGLGLNYTTFFHESPSSAAKDRLGASNLRLKDSWGLALEIGIDWRIDERWLLNASAWRMDIDSNAKLDTGLGTVKTHVNIDPWVYMLGIGFKL